MPITRHRLLHELDGDNTEIDTEEPDARQVPRTPVRGQFPEEEIFGNMAKNAPDRRDSDANADHQMAITLTVKARICFGAGFNPHEHKAEHCGFLP